MKTFVCASVLVCLLAGTILAGPSPNREAMYHRIVCVVPIIGAPDIYYRAVSVCCFCGGSLPGSIRSLCKRPVRKQERIGEHLDY